MVNKEKLESTIRLLEKTKQEVFSSQQTQHSSASEQKEKNAPHPSVNEEADAFAKQVDDLIAGKLRMHDKLMVMSTPLVMQICDERVKALPVVVSQRTLKKIFKKHDISPELVKELPKALSEPIIVFESERKNGQVQDGFVMMLNLKDKTGATINVPIALDSKQGHTYECNVITSMYGRHDKKSGELVEQWFVEQAVKKNLVKFIDIKKFSRWLDESRLALPGRYHQQELDSILVHADDFVKQNQEIIEQILSANPNAKTEADLEAAREQIYMPSVLEADRRMTSAEEHEEELKTLEERLNKLNVELNIDSPNPSLGNEGETIEAEFKEEQQEENTPEGAAASINTEPEVEDKSESSDIDAKIKAAGINTDELKKDVDSIIANFETQMKARTEALKESISTESEEKVKNKGIEMYSLGRRELTQLDKESSAFAKQVDDYINKKLGRYDELKVMTTPLVMQISDERVKPLPIVMSQRTLGKIFQKHNISPELVKELPKALSEPIMIFESERKDGQVKDGFVIMLDLKDKNGGTINVPVALNSIHGRMYECNVITSMYGRLKEKNNKPKDSWFINQAQKEGVLKYVDKEKLSRWLDDARLYLPGRGDQRESSSIIADSDDFVKQNQKIIGQILSVNPNAKTEADLEAAREHEQQLPKWENENGIRLDIQYIEKSPARRGLGPIPKSLIQGREITHIVRTKEDLVNAIDMESKKKLREQISKALSVKDVRDRVKGADVVDLGDGKMRLDFANGMKWLVDTKAEKININPDVVKRDYGRDVQPEDVVSGRTRILNGETFIDLVAGMSDAKTFSHEVFEASWNILTEDEQNTLLNTYKSREGAADRYAAYLEGRVKENASPAMAVFQKLKDFFQDIRATLFGRESEDIFRQIAEGKVYERKVQMQENTERYELKAKSNNKEEQNMSEQERKTTTLVAGNDFIRKDFKHGKVMYGKVLGPIRTSEREQNGEKEYFASFNLAVGGKVTRVRVTSRQPIDIKTYKEGQEPVFVSGQTFLVSPKDKGKIIGERVPVLYARAIHEAEHFLKNEKGEYVYDKNGEPQKLAPPRAGRAIVSKEDCIHNELESSSKELLVGIVKESKYNVFDKALGQADKPYGYESKFRLTTVDRDKDGKPKKDEQGKTAYKVITVHCITKQPMHLDQAVSRNESSTKLLSLKGAYQMHDVKRPSDNTILRDVVTFDPVVISQYKEREKEKEKGKEAPKQETEVRAANVKDGVYKGQIISQDVENAMFIQKVGSREYSHNAANFKVKPEVGKDVKIVYKDGKGTFRAIDKEKEQANER